MSDETVRYLATRAGEVYVAHRPLPPLPPKRIRVRTFFSGVSAGTELLALANSRANTEIHPLGYQLAGVVEAMSDELGGLYYPGDMVACYGAPYVTHASIVDVPPHLLTPVPPSLPLQHAAFGGLGAIALHAFRCSKLKLGESAIVLGLGMLGNLVAQLAYSAGCQVVGMDLLPSRVTAAAECGIESFDNIDALKQRTRGMAGGHGCDAVFLTAANCSDSMVAVAFDLLRRGGTVLLAGTSDAALPREAMFAKEARLLVPRAAGPGRYDHAYESDALDYPYPYVRWTQGRNLQEFIRQIATGRVQLGQLVTEVLPISQSVGYYQRLVTGHSSPGTVFTWPDGNTGND